jgi:hypothetical protein
LSYFQPNLILDEFRVREGCVVKYEEVGRGCADEIDDKAKDPISLVSQCRIRAKTWVELPGNEVQTQGLSVDIVSGPGALIGIL